MSKLNITPGPAKAERMINPPKSKDRRCGFVVNSTGIIEDGGLQRRICDLKCPVGMDGFTEGKANAEFIAEAFNTAHKTGLTPRQLVEKKEQFKLLAGEAIECLDEIESLPVDDHGARVIPPGFLNKARTLIAMRKLFANE